MKRSTHFALLAFAAILMLSFATTGFAQSEDPAPAHGPNFIDENGDGYNDNAPDADGDGIPNRYDPDWEYFIDEDGDGVSDQTPGRKDKGRHAFVDENGDGYNDNAPDADGDGIPNRYDSDWEFFVDEDGDGISDQTPGRKGNKGRLFIDEDGDGVCDMFQDEDGDGIVNCKDEDWDRPAGQGKRRIGNRHNRRRNAPADGGNEPEDGTGN